MTRKLTCRASNRASQNTSGGNDKHHIKLFISYSGANKGIRQVVIGDAIVGAPVSITEHEIEEDSISHIIFCWQEHARDLVLYRYVESAVDSSVTYASANIIWTIALIDKNLFEKTEFGLSFS